MNSSQYMSNLLNQILCKADFPFSYVLLASLNYAQSRKHHSLKVLMNKTNSKVSQREKKKINDKKNVIVNPALDVSICACQCEFIKNQKS